MIETEFVVNANDVARAFRVLRNVEPDLVKAFRREMRSDLKPAAKAIAEKYPSTPYLSGLAPYGSVKAGRGGFTRVKFDRESGSIKAKENWVWSQVVGKVSITPGKARKGVGVNNLVALRMQYKGAIPWVTDMAKPSSPDLSPQGKALIRNIEKRYPDWPNGGRIFYKAFMGKRGEVFSKAEKIMGKFIDDVNKVI